MSRRSKDVAEVATEAPEQEVARLTIERDRLAKETLFREDALASLERTVAVARQHIDQGFPPMFWLENQAPGVLADRLGGFALIASDWFYKGQLERIAGPPRPGYPSVQWSALTKAETAERIAAIDVRLGELDVVLRIQAARDRAAAELEEAERLERGEVEPAGTDPDPQPEGEQTPAEALEARKAAQEAAESARRVAAGHALDADDDLGWKTGP